ncbi:MAG: PQQ-binding-like beta-propeller repeat protein, partial [Planctomycetota bacterium]|nr:PQQ-binding-like beta-propeller repeat protein [Planctomycetota bacterium]
MPSSFNFRRQRVFIAGMRHLWAYSQPDEWLASPPVVVGGLVLLAPHDSEELLAFDRTTGELRWQFDRNRHRYIVGANDRVVVVAGRKVTAVDLETGKAAWSFDDHRPTGRPALSGDRVLVPTKEGLLALSAENGKPVGDAARSKSVLGNLLVADGALYSISVHDISKFPDPMRTRELAERRLARNPDDLDAIVRLAWLAGLEDDWEQALSLIEPLAPNGEDLQVSESAAVDAGRRDRIAHLRVSALIALADKAQPAERIDLLLRAVSAARRSDDVVRAGLEYCDSLVEQGQHRLASERGMAMLADVGDEPVRWDDGLDVRASVLIAERLRRFDRSMSDEDRAALAARFTAAVDSGLDGGDTKLVGRLVDNVPWREEGARADLRLAGAARAQGRLETASYHLERAVRRAPGTNIAAEALAMHVLLLASPGDGLPAAPAPARSVLRELKTEYSGRPLPAEIFAAMRQGGRGDVDAFVAAIETVLPSVASSESGGRVAANYGRGKLYVEYEECDTTDVNHQTRMFYDSYSKDDGWGAALPVKFAEQVKGVRVDFEKSGEHCWSSEINTTVELEHRANVGFGGFPGPVPSAPTQRLDPGTRAAAISGRVAALDLGGEIHAIGLTTGRSMWRPMTINREFGALPEPSVVAVSGMIIASTDAHTLVGIPARQDAAPLWRRRFDRRPMGRLAKVDGHAVVIDVNAQWLWVVDPTSGRIVREFSLLVGDKHVDSGEFVAEEKDPDARIALAGGAVFRNGRKRVVARDIVTGRVLWEMPFRRRVMDLITLDEHHIGVTHGIDRFTVVRAETGEMVKELEIEDLEMPPIGATLDWPDAANRLSQGRLLIFAKTDDDPPRYKIVSFPLDDSEV